MNSKLNLMNVHIFKIYNQHSTDNISINQILIFNFIVYILIIIQNH